MGFDIDDAAVIDMARGWPQIEDIEVMTPTYHGQGPVPRVTLAALLAFAQYCPRLAKLRIVLDASVVSVPRAYVCTPQSTLVWLDVGYSRVLAAPPVAHFLSVLFPQLSDLPTDHNGERYPGADGMHLEYSQAFHPIWKEVETLLCGGEASIKEL
ncbi:hypothetical protein B0H16DRAFT_1742315 [Mycena metata]|uniref:Uncharacterized protein n=1 Tax=Mycena metata TaxID=1033252 RepID=A0AAD7H8D7_9AGAR|nr:hypothetical protein B0H16DRAFT_1742315 [Mycena metata]